MSDATLGLPPALTDWMRAMGVAETPALKALRDETMALDGIGHWATAPEQGQLNVLLARMIGARSYVELGTFTILGSLHDRDDFSAKFDEWDLRDGSGFLVRSGVSLFLTETEIEEVLCKHFVSSLRNHKRSARV